MFLGDRGGDRFGGGGGRFGGRGGGGGGGPGRGLRKPHWDMQQLRPFKKDFYIPHPAVASRSPYEVEAFRQAKEITTDVDAPNPIQNFDEANFPDYVLGEVRNQGKSILYIFFPLKPQIKMFFRL